MRLLSCKSHLTKPVSCTNTKPNSFPDMKTWFKRLASKKKKTSERKREDFLWKSQGHPEAKQLLLEKSREGTEGQGRHYLLSATALGTLWFKGGERSWQLFS